MLMMREMDEKREGIRKGPWRAEEDEVLINHVKKYGPRDWSSIRSKGLLQRTGKSCRLRWVNKLRPNLKNGCKFTAEEERVVIDLQAQFGNKWARIATYLPGRTDNDVKNFWSSRQKRLARIFRNSAAPSDSTSKKVTSMEAPHFHGVPDLQASKFSFSMAEESSSKASSCSLSYMENSEAIKMVAVPELVNPKLNFDANMSELQHVPMVDNPCAMPQLDIPFYQIPQPQAGLQELLARFEDPYFSDAFAPMDSPELGNGTIGPPFFESVRSCGHSSSSRDETNNPVSLDAFDDLPTDMFDHMDAFQSPPQ